MVAPLHSFIQSAPAHPWLVEWLHLPLRAARDAGRLDRTESRELAATLGESILAYVEWFESDGLTELLDLATRRTRGDWSQATEATTETFLDVRDRLEQAVERAVAGRSIPQLSTREDVVRYHRIQLTLRLKGRWTKARNHADIHDLPVGTPESTSRDVDARRQALPLHVAACWTLADFAKSDRDAGWWWRILRHCLDLDTVTELGGHRNDPTEAHLRIQARFSACRGLRRVLEASASARLSDSCSQVDLRPELPEDTVMSEVCAMVDELRPALGRAIGAMDLEPAEAKALTKVLVQGATVRTRLKHFAGSDSASRRARLCALSEQAGGLVASELLAARAAA